MPSISNKNKYIDWIIREKYNGDKEALGLCNDIMRLKNGEPIDYIIGFIEFCGAKIDLNFRPMIPRVETEFWVSQIIEKTLKKDKRKKIKCLDLFSGSGCIGIAILKQIPHSYVDFADIEPKFLRQILHNLRLNNITKERFGIIKSNIFCDIKSKYNYILANPPYVALEKFESLQKSVKKFEPRISFVGGYGGLDIIKDFLSQGYKYLKKKGEIYMEFSSEQKESISRFLTKFYNYYKHCEFYQDQYKRWRYLKLKV